MLTLKSVLTSYPKLLGLPSDMTRGAAGYDIVGDIMIIFMDNIIYDIKDL
jgi:hypothetical protein